MAIKIAFINNKGGSAKTTTLVNLAGAIHERFKNKRILIVEGDAQGNASTSFGLSSDKINDTIYDVFMEKCDVADAVQNVLHNIDIIPANMDMNFLEFDLMERADDGQKHTLFNLMKLLDKEGIDVQAMTYEMFDEVIPEESSATYKYFNMLSGKLDAIEDSYDIIMFDTPPELKSVTSSILAVADIAIIPFEPDVYSIDGIVNILSRIRTIQNEFNPELKVGGILASKVKAQTKLHRDVRAKIKDFCNENDINYFKNEIPNSIRFASATAYMGLPATIAKPQNEFSKAYYDLLDELIKLKVIKWR